MKKNVWHLSFFPITNFSSLKKIAIYICLICSGCNHLFYYPDQHFYVDPKKVNVNKKELTVAANNRESLHVWYLLPKSKPKGVVLHFHGNAQNMTAHHLYSSWLTEFGYIVVTFDYRGYGSSGGEVSRENTVEDGAVMLNHLQNKKEWSNLPRYVFAQSLGGAVAVSSLARAKEIKVDALILESTFASYRDLAKTKLASNPLTWIFQWPLQYLISDDLSPVDFAASVRVPMLMIHGTHDSVVPFSEGMALFEAFPEGKKTFWRLKGAGHTAAFTNPKNKLRERLVDYLKSHRS